MSGALPADMSRSESEQRVRLKPNSSTCWARPARSANSGGGSPAVQGTPNASFYILHNRIVPGTRHHMNHVGWLLIVLVVALIAAAIVALFLGVVPFS